MSEITTIGLDLAKHVFQVHGIDAQGTTVLRKRLRRGQVLAFFSRIPRCVVGLEACATAHYWARELGALGHEVRLMPAQYVKAYIKRNKHDAADAEAICEAVQRPTMRFVPVKTAEQQATALLHRGREQLVRQRTMLVNALRAHLAEFGIVAAQGLRNVGELIAIVRDDGDTRLPDVARQVLQRRLLINGASANLLRSKATKADPWVIGLRRRRPPLVVAVALANKTARIAWAVMLREKEYQPRAVAA
jgi:transposase